MTDDITINDDGTEDCLSDFTDLHHAALRGDIDEVRALLAQGADPNAFEEFGSTPLHFAADDGHIEIVRLLLEAGADVNFHLESKIGNTPLGEAAGHCSREMAGLLLQFGADPTIRGWINWNALDKTWSRGDEEGRTVHALLRRYSPTG